MVQLRRFYKSQYVQISTNPASETDTMLTPSSLALVSSSHWDGIDGTWPYTAVGGSEREGKAGMKV